MNCEEFTFRLADFVDGDRSRAERTRCEEHRAACRDCEAYMASYESTIRLARGAFRGDESAVSVKSVEALIARILDRTVLRSEPI